MGNIRHSFNTSNQETTFSQMPYRLLYSSYSKYEQDWESYPHTHYFSELFYVLNGCGSFIVEEESFPIRKQNLIIINPSIRHTEVSDKNSPLEYIVLGVEGLNFLIYNDKESSGRWTNKKKATRRSVKIFSKLSSFNFHDIPDRP